MYRPRSREKFKDQKRNDEKPHLARPLVDPAALEMSHVIHNWRWGCLSDTKPTELWLVLSHPTSSQSSSNTLSDSFRTEKASSHPDEGVPDSLNISSLGSDSKPLG